MRKPANNADALLNHCQALLPSRVERDHRQQTIRYGQGFAPVIEPFQFPGNDNLLGDGLLCSARQVHQVILITCSDLSRNRESDHEQRENKPNNPES